jgi:hypothetical protein
MSLSQFSSPATISEGRAPGTGPDDGAKRSPMIHVGGPLELDSPEDYVHPILVHFAIIQSEEDDHDPANAKRTSGVGREIGRGKWAGAAPAGKLKSGKPARGIAVAVLEKKEQFAYETITWCEHIDVVPRAKGGRAPRAEQDGLAALRFR